MIEKYVLARKYHGGDKHLEKPSAGCVYDAYWVKAEDYAALEARCRELEALTKEASRDIDLPAEWHDKFRELFRNSPAETVDESRFDDHCRCRNLDKGHDPECWYTPKIKGDAGDR